MTVIWPLAIQLVLAYQGEVPRSGRGDHLPAQASIWLIDRGWCRVQASGLRLSAAAGDLIFLPASYKRWQDFSFDARIASVNLKVRSADGSEVLQDHRPFIGAQQELPKLVAAARGVISVVDHVENRHPTHVPSTTSLPLAVALDLRAAGDRLAAVLLRTLEISVEPDRQLDSRLLRALAILRNRPSQGPAPYRELSATTGLGRARIDQLFRERLQTSPKRIRDEACLQVALDRLGDPDRPIKAISHELGFTDPSHFSKWFKKQMGTTPARHRQQATWV